MYQPVEIRILTSVETLVIKHHKSAKLIVVRKNNFDTAVDICFASKDGKQL